MSDCEALPNYREFAPPTTLAHIVDAFWCLSSPRTTTQTNPLKHRAFPNGCVGLFCRYQCSALEGRLVNPTLMIYGPTAIAWDGT